MKKILTIIMLFVMIFVLSACTKNEGYNLTAYYDFENRQCNILNISKNTDFEELKVTIVLNAKNNFSKEITYDIGTLDSGETYTGDLSYISEDIEITNVYIDSYEYYKNEIFETILLVILIIILVIVICA